MAERRVNVGWAEGLHARPIPSAHAVVDALGDAERLVRERRRSLVRLRRGQLVEPLQRCVGVALVEQLQPHHAVGLSVQREEGDHLELRAVVDPRRATRAAAERAMALGSLSQAVTFME